MPFFRLSPLMAALSLIIPCYVMGETLVYGSVIKPSDSEPAIAQVTDLLRAAANVSPNLDGDIPKKNVSKTP